MALKASEISELLKQRIKNFESAAEARDVGTVIAVTDGICRIHGLADAKYGEMLEFPKNTFGLALNLEQDSVGAVVLGVDGADKALDDGALVMRAVDAQQHRGMGMCRRLRGGVPRDFGFRGQGQHISSFGQPPAGRRVAMERSFGGVD